MAAGRTRDFDTQEALEHAMHVFWKKGFLDASLTDLTSSMGINKPSLYATFGNKEDLFVSALAHYLDSQAAQHTVLLSKRNKPLTERLRAYLRSLTNMLCDPTKPGGCFVAVATNEIAGQSLPEKAKQTILDANNYTETFLTKFFEAEKNTNHLPANTNIKDLSLFIVTLIHGMAAMSRSGKSEVQVCTTIDIALLAVSKMIETNNNT